MNDFETLKFDLRRYQIAKSCPCGRSNRDGKFVPYKGFYDKGYCHSCGKTFRPEIEPSITAAFPWEVNRKQGQPTFIQSQIFRRTLVGYDRNFFAQFLKNRFGSKRAAKVIGDYFVGTTRDSSTVFWQIDSSGHIRTGNIIKFDPLTGKRHKGIVPKWAHVELRLRDFRLKQCLFGEHLLRENKMTVVVVESQKTACIGSIYFPQALWLACGGKDGLTIEKLQTLRGRKVVLFPDLDGFDLWTRRAAELSPMLDIRVSNLLERKATPCERNAKLDIADYLLRFDPAEFQKNSAPYVETLIDGTQMLMHPTGYPAD